jgi:hypothetical protein
MGLEALPAALGGGEARRVQRRVSFAITLGETG